MTNEEKALRIVVQAGGNQEDCLDWLNDGDGNVMDLWELIQEWRENGCEYSA